MAFWFFVALVTKGEIILNRIKLLLTKLSVSNKSSQRSRGSGVKTRGTWECFRWKPWKPCELSRMQPRAVSMWLCRIINSFNKLITWLPLPLLFYISLLNLIRLVMRVPQDPAGCFLQQKWAVIPAFFTFLCCRFWSGWRRPCSRPRFTCCPPTMSVGSATLGSCPLTPASRKSLCPWVGRHLTLK